MTPPRHIIVLQGVHLNGNDLLRREVGRGKHLQPPLSLTTVTRGFRFFTVVASQLVPGGRTRFAGSTFGSWRPLWLSLLLAADATVPHVL